MPVKLSPDTTLHSEWHHVTVNMVYRIAGYFRGVLSFVIFVVHPGVTKFSTHGTFHTLCSAVNMFSNLRFVMALFRYLQCPWSTESPISMLAVPRVRAEEVNREV